MPDQSSVLESSMRSMVYFFRYFKEFVAGSGPLLELGVVQEHVSRLFSLAEDEITSCSALFRLDPLYTVKVMQSKVVTRTASCIVHTRDPVQ
jgi:hypothetical protein